MNKLALSALMIGGLLQTAGCIITTNSDDGIIDGAGQFSVSWDATECPAGAAAEVLSQNQAGGEPLVDIYNCIDGGGTTAPLALGTYDVWVEVTSADGSQLFAQSNAVTQSLVADLEIANVAIPSFPMGAGFFGFTWSLVDTSGAALTCAEVFSGGVDIIATSATTSEATVDVYDCTDGAAVTPEYPIDTYTIVVDVLDESDQALGTSQARDESITFGNQLVDLGNFEFLFQ